VNGATCGGNAGAYPNKPCVRVTVCLPGTATCVTIDDVLLDTGSYGLRLFTQVLPFSLAPTRSGTGTLTECVQYLGGSSHWGPVAVADVILGAAPTVRVPIQVIDATFGTPPASCPKPETGPPASGFNGILGVGTFAEDCGVGCSSGVGNGFYYACTGPSCLETTAPLASQVANPVARLPADNNGVIVVLPPVASGGQLTVTGSLILGIDTQANNASTGATAYGADSSGDLRTSYDGATLGGFLDTGSNGLFFPAPRSGALPACSAPNGAWFCPSTRTSVTATNASTSGSPSGAVTFSISNAQELFGTGNNALGELGGAQPANSGFDFGLPFFFGQRVYIGIEGRSSTRLGRGPYFAY
jgi:hypothetical protein